MGCHQARPGTQVGYSGQNLLHVQQPICLKRIIVWAWQTQAHSRPHKLGSRKMCFCQPPLEERRNWIAQPRVVLIERLVTRVEEIDWCL